MIKQGKIMSFVPSVVLILMVLGLAGTTYYFYSELKSVKSSQSVKDSGKKEIEQVVSEVNKLMELPKGEEPVIATVTDINKLKQQPFFAQAKNGDRVLIYIKSSMAIIYRPQIKKIIKVAPLVINSKKVSDGVEATNSSKLAK